MSDVKSALRGLVATLGDEGVSRLATELESRATDTDKDWQSALLVGLASGVRREGKGGLDKAYHELTTLVRGRKSADLKFMSYRDRAMLVSKLQKIDIRKRQKVQSYLQFAFSIIKKVLLAIL